MDMNFKSSWKNLPQTDESKTELYGHSFVQIKESFLGEKSHTNSKVL